jgi:hypothetical protein
LELAGEASATATVSFQFVPAKTLTQLANGGTLESTSYSGSFSAIPEPSTYAAIISAVSLGFAFISKTCKGLRRRGLDTLFNAAK